MKLCSSDNHYITEPRNATKCVQNDSKVRTNIGMKLIKINLGMKLFFLLVVKHTQIHLFDSVHSYGCGQAHQSLPKVILNIKVVLEGTASLT